MEQLSIFEEDSSKSIKVKIEKEMYIAIKKGIIPGAIVCIDNSNKYKYIVSHLFVDNDKKLTASLSNDGNLMSWHITSDRIKVIGYFD